MVRKAKTGGPPYPEFRLDSWDAFLKMITDSPYSNWAFRGHRKEKWPLYSSLSRYFRNFGIHPKAWPEQESRILRVFKRKAHQFLPHPPDPEDSLQWMALMQHHGAPTRLLDFTWSPYVAAFFALTHATSEAAVWALNPIELSGCAPRPTNGSEHSATSDMDPKIKGNFERYFLKGDRLLVWVGEPDTMNRRLIAQSGTFVVPSRLDVPMEEILSRYPQPETKLVKFILPSARLRETGLRELYRMNITYATLFPDLDGLGRSMAYELEFHWAYNPRTMKPLA